MVSCFIKTHKQTLEISELSVRRITDTGPYLFNLFENKI